MASYTSKLKYKLCFLNHKDLGTSNIHLVCGKNFVSYPTPGEGMVFFPSIMSKKDGKILSRNPR